MRRLTFVPLLTGSLLACTPEKDTTTASTAASTSDGTTTGTTSEATATGDPPGTTSTGATVTGAPIDDCAFVAGKTFKSDDELECGLGPNGVELCNWTLTFTVDAYTHQYSDVGDQGSYTCADGVITAIGSGDTPHGGTIDADTGALVWDDIVYHPAP